MSARTILDEYDSAAAPKIDEQREFWDDWNREMRFREALDAFTQRERDVTVQTLEELGIRDASILEIGCGVGWLACELARFGNVVATDLAPATIAEARRRYPQVTFECADFYQQAIGGPYELVVMCDSLANMSDPSAAIRRVATLLVRGGIYLLMTPNRAVWRWRTGLRRRAPGQYMAWPTRSAYRKMLQPWFTVQQIRTIAPGGDCGPLWWVERQNIERAMNRLVGQARWRALLERAGLGRQLVIVARRNDVTIAD
jgi:SAM-dependent methyltransferase